MKKIFTKIILFATILSFIIPISFNLNVNNTIAATEWYFTKTNNLLYNVSSGAVTFIGGSTSLAECNTKRSATPSVNNYTLGPCTEKVEAPAGEGWGYNVNTASAPVLANNPIAFKTEEGCNTNRGNYLDSDVHKNDTNATNISPCVYKKGVSNDGVVNVTPQIGATENNNIYKLLVPLPGITCMDNTGQDTTCIGNNVGKYLNLIFKFGIGLCAALAVVMLIIYGVVYMGDESVFGKTEAKHKMFGAIIGLIIAIGGWVLLNTINPDLTGKNGLTIDQVSVILEENLVFFDAKNVTGLNYGDDLFLGYMAHQQGAGGIKAIITAAQNNTSVSNSTMTNMKSNFPTNDAKNTIGTSDLTPTNFLLYWSKKLAAAKQSTTTVYGEADTALGKASQDTGVDKSILVAMCRIESAKHCSTKESITSVNGSYSGLFQLGNDVWNKYKRSTDSDIFDPYANARVAALYFKDNLKIVKS